MCKILTQLLVAIYILMTVYSTVFALGEGNIDGGGGGMGQGTSQNYWIGGDDGVRVTIIHDSDKTTISTPIDMTNISPDNIKISFGRVSKMEYKNGVELAPESDTYVYHNPDQPLPRIISSDGNANIDAIKRYFCSEYAIMLIANITGFDYKKLIDGEYKLLLEPIAYFTFRGVKVAMTAHEAALYDQVLGGKLRSSMPSLTHKNLPLAMFLEASDMGFPAWDGPTSQKVSDDDIISSLGLGIVRFGKADTPATISGNDYEYRVDTDVITSVTLTTETMITPKNPASVTFHIDGTTYRITDIVIPEGESQVVWVKWHTSRYPAIINITVDSNTGTANHKNITAKIVDLNEKIPPDLGANDTRPDGYKIPTVPSLTEKTSASWGVWSCHWHANFVWVSSWVWHSYKDGSGSWDDIGRWVDKGYWVYSYTGYSANLEASMTVSTGNRVPTASGKTMKSGYGISLNVKTGLRSNAPASAITGAQNVLSYYPEFNYNTYFRQSEMMAGGYNAEFELKQNEFSTYGERVHFTPIWFPDGTYSPIANVIDAWTPVGMLSCNLSDYVNIKGSLFDDWHRSPKQ